MEEYHDIRGAGVGNALLVRIMQLVKNTTVSCVECVILTQLCVFSKLSLTNSVVSLDTSFIAVSSARQKMKGDIACHTQLAHS